MSERKRGEEYVISETLNENPYLKGFLGDLYLRPSCHDCPSKSLKSGSDITLADFWGVEHELPEMDDDRGVSLVILNSERGRDIFEQLGADSIQVGNSVFKYNPSLHNSVKPHKNRSRFFRQFKRGKTQLLSLIDKFVVLKITLWDKIVWNSKRIFNN